MHLFKEAQRVAFHISASAPKVSDSSDRTESTSSLRPQALNFSNISVNDSVLSGTTDNSVHISPPKLKSPRQRKNTFTKEDSALENLSETLNKALPEVEPVPRDENGKIQFSAHGQKKVGEVKSSGFARGGTIRRSLPTSVGRGLKPVGNKSSGGLKPPNQVILLVICKDFENGEKYVEYFDSHTEHLPVQFHFKFNCCTLMKRII